jgi:hypothetical protein
VLPINVAAGKTASSPSPLRLIGKPFCHDSEKPKTQAGRDESRLKFGALKLRVVSNEYEIIFTE